MKSHLFVKVSQMVSVTCNLVNVISPCNNMVVSGNLSPSLSLSLDLEGPFFLYHLTSKEKQ